MHAILDLDGPLCLSPHPHRHHPADNEITFGLNQVHLSAAGLSVAEIASAMHDTLSIDPDAIEVESYINGKKVSADTVLLPGDRLEFQKKMGCKGGFDDDQLWREDLVNRLYEIEQRIEQLIQSQNEIQELLLDKTTRKEFYSPAEVAEIVGKKPLTVREWCRLKRINARKRPIGRGDTDEWEISHEEIERYKNHGLLPIPTKY